MDKQQLKAKLYQEIESLDNEMALHMLHDAAVEYNRLGNKDILDDLSPEQLERLEESLQQLDNGQVKSHEEVMKMARTWLRK